MSERTPYERRMLARGGARRRPHPLLRELPLALRDRAPQHRQLRRLGAQAGRAGRAAVGPLASGPALRGSPGLPTGAARGPRARGGRLARVAVGLRAARLGLRGRPGRPPRAACGPSAQSGGPARMAVDCPASSPR